MAETGQGRRGQLERLNPGDLQTKQAQLIGLSGTGSPFTQISRACPNSSADLPRFVGLWQLVDIDFIRV